MSRPDRMLTMRCWDVGSTLCDVTMALRQCKSYCARKDVVLYVWGARFEFGRMWEITTFLLAATLSGTLPSASVSSLPCDVTCHVLSFPGEAVFRGCVVGVTYFCCFGKLNIFYDPIFRKIHVKDIFWSKSPFFTKIYDAEVVNVLGSCLLLSSAWGAVALHRSKRNGLLINSSQY